MERATRLRQAETEPPPGARVIDADYVVVRKGRRAWLGKLKLALSAALIAALLGLLAPPLLIAANAISALL